MIAGVSFYEEFVVQSSSLVGGKRFTAGLLLIWHEQAHGSGSKGVRQEEKAV